MKNYQYGFIFFYSKNNYLPGCLLYWRLLFLYISCSLFRSLWNSSKFFGLILKTMILLSILWSQEGWLKVQKSFRLTWLFPGPSRGWRWCRIRPWRGYTPPAPPSRWRASCPATAGWTPRSAPGSGMGHSQTETGGHQCSSHRSSLQRSEHSSRWTWK